MTTPDPPDMAPGALVGDLLSGDGPYESRWLSDPYYDGALYDGVLVGSTDRPTTRVYEIPIYVLESNTSDTTWSIPWETWSLSGDPRVDESSPPPLPPT